MSIGTTVELREFEEKNNMDKMGNISLALIGRGNGISVEYFINSFVLTRSML